MNRTLKVFAGVLAAVAVLAGVAAAASSPGVSTGKATGIKTTSAILHGTVNPNGATTGYRFEWGLTTAYGLGTTSKSAGSGTKAIAVQATAANLIPGTVYHFRIAALSKAGGAFGSDRTFKTAGNPPPGAVTGPVSQISANTATVTGVVNPNNEATRWWVQYGATPFYGFQTAPQTIPATKLALPVSVQLTQLQSGVTFHYRLVAQHGTSIEQAGADLTFVTFPSPRPQSRLSAKTSPGRDKSSPYTFTTSGRVSRSRFLPQSVQCTGSVTVRFFNGKRRIGSNLFAVAPDCSYSGQTTFRHKPGHGKRNRQVHLKLLIHFRGNNYLTPSDARQESVTIG